jgi:hypothetical protein
MQFTLTSVLREAEYNEADDRPLQTPVCGTVFGLSLRKHRTKYQGEKNWALAEISSIICFGFGNPDT